MSERDYKTLLRFGEQWFRLGLLGETELHALGQRYETGDDKNTEHYRYEVFQDYLVQRNLSFYSAPEYGHHQTLT